MAVYYTCRRCNEDRIREDRYTEGEILCRTCEQELLLHLAESSSEEDPTCPR